MLLLVFYCVFCLHSKILNGIQLPCSHSVKEFTHIVPYGWLNTVHKDCTGIRGTLSVTQHIEKSVRLWEPVCRGQWIQPLWSKPFKMLFVTSKACKRVIVLLFSSSLKGQQTPFHIKHCSDFLHQRQNKSKSLSFNVKYLLDEGQEKKGAISWRISISQTSFH